MNSELTMTPFRAAALLRRFKHDEKMLGSNEQAAIDFAISAITALTTSQPAPTSQDLERAAKMCGGFAAPDMAAALRGQPAQAGEVASNVRDGGVVIQCPMCAYLDEEATCRLCSLIPSADVSEWQLAVRVAGPVPNTGLVPVKARTLLAINSVIANAVAAQAQPAAQATPAQQAAGEPVVHTYASTQATNCAGCGKHKHTPLRIDAMGGYVCLTCIDNKLGSLLGEFGYPEPDDTHPAPAVPDVEDLRDRLVAISAAVADCDDRAAQSMLGEILRLLAAAQAKAG